MKEPHAAPDTGTLRGDLLSMFCGMGGLTDERATSILASVITAIGRDADFAACFRERFIAPKAALSTAVFKRARARGEIHDGVDLDLVVPALPGILLHRQFLLGESTEPACIERVIDQIILPAVAAGPASPHDQPSPPTLNEKTEDH